MMQMLALRIVLATFVVLGVLSQVELSLSDIWRLAACHMVWHVDSCPMIITLALEG